MISLSVMQQIARRQDVATPRERERERKRERERIRSKEHNSIHMSGFSLRTNSKEGEEGEVIDLLSSI